jgi:hypothetical protein
LGTGCFTPSASMRHETHGSSWKRDFGLRRRTRAKRAASAIQSVIWAPQADVLVTILNKGRVDPHRGNLAVARLSSARRESTDVENSSSLRASLSAHTRTRTVKRCQVETGLRRRTTPAGCWLPGSRVITIV